MADGTHISWSDATWNPVTGCEVLSPGCSNCYAMRLAGTRLTHHPSRKGLTTMTKTGPVWNGDVRFNEKALDQPLRWRKPRRIFVVAHGDLFYERVPDEWIDRIFAVMALCPQHIFQVLTKRADRMRTYLTRADLASIIYPLAEKITGQRSWADAAKAGREGVGWPLPNVHLGFSAEDQKHFDARWADVEPLARAGWTTWCSAEPLLGPIDARGALANGLRGIAAGGESAQNKPGRPSHPEWFRSLRDQCAAAGVPFHFKQWGDWVDGSMPGGYPHAERRVVTHDGHDLPWHFNELKAASRDRLLDRAKTMTRVGARRAGRLLDGREHNDLPGAKG